MNELDDMVGTTASAFLGLTVACARCHDHKYDPIRQADYYRMQAVFYPTEKTNTPLATDEEVEANKDARKEIEDQIEPLRRSIGLIERSYRDEMRRKMREERFPADIREAFATPEDKRTEGQKLIVEQANKTIDAHYKYDEMEKLFTVEHAEAIRSLRELVGKLEAKKPASLPVAMALKDSSAKPPAAHFLNRGSHLNKGPEVKPAAPSVFAFASNDLQSEPSEKSTMRRTALAKWIANPENPLTARVMVNRIWKHHFGRGIVATPSDFGNAGERPTHQELLDYLALKFIENSWSIKSMHRLIMNSAAYQMSSIASANAAQADPDNMLFSRQNSQRMEAEALRDSILAVAGRLNPKPGGPGYLPPISEEMKISLGAALPQNPTDDPEELHRRTVYMYQKRNLPAPMLEVLDLPDSNITCSRRDTSTVPTQALTLFNNEFMMSQAEFLSKKITEDRQSDVDQLIREAGMQILSRPLTDKEIEMGKTFVRREMLRAILSEEANDELEIAMTDFCRVLMNTNEFVYVR